MPDNNWVDFRLVKAQVSMQLVLDHYGVNWLQNKGSERYGKCPIHKGEGERTFHVSVSKNAFNCFSCHKRGNVLDFVAAMEGCSVRDAALKLAAWFNIDSAAEEVGETGTDRATMSAPEAARPRPKLKEPKNGPINPPLSFHLRIDSNHEYGLKRGLTIETLATFGAGLCLSKGTFSGRFVIPLHDGRGQLVGYAGRSLDDSEPRYLFPPSDKGFYKSHLLFNLHRVIKNAGADTPVVVVEGFFGTMNIHQAGFPCVGLLGSWLSAEQEELLAAHFNRAILMLDGDAAGRQGTVDALTRLSRRMFVRVVDLPDGVQPDALDVKDIHRWCS